MHVTLFMVASLGAFICVIILSGFFMKKFVRQEFLWALTQRRMGGYFYCARLDIPVILALSGAAYSLPIAMFISLCSTCDDMGLKVFLVILAWGGGAALCFIFYCLFWQEEERAFREAYEKTQDL